MLISDTTHLISYIVSVTLFFNIILALAIIFLERRESSSIWAWLLVLFFIPIVGFILYLLLGRKLTRRRMFRWSGRKKIGIETLVDYQIESIKEGSFEYKLSETASKYKELIYMNLLSNHAVLTQDNHIHIFDDGQDKFDRLLEDIAEAKHHIHIQYYIFRLDRLGTRILDALIEKARQGVQVRVLYDEMGSRGVHKKDFKALIEQGGEVEVFFPSVLPLINPRMNYRNHRKIVVIDGKVGYIGGFNVGDEYLGLKEKFGYWRDTHLRINGSSVQPLQTRFLLDWNQASDRKNLEYEDSFFPTFYRQGNTAIQIVSSGPDSDWEAIKNGYIKLINMAKKYVYIQTPYFIPDDAFINAVRIACLSGIDVRIMIPNKPDHIFVYWATYYYVGLLIEAGAKVYVYENGFLHTKMVVIDDEAASVGTANIDSRSFKLNFEANAFIYDTDVAHQLAELFERDILYSSELTPEKYKNRSTIIKLKESISRLLSPIL
ncbi:MAG: cardiolipin synthase [Kurthia gibsonii]|uniref:cardiolipin synthase n=1 Tax=Kurthia TaxID=1649 RepID=UPI000745E648|nr:MULTISPECIES: cardiolipin synthase [Kurthia]MCA9724113.1 cardiolipin synthase [Kurthia sp.]AMA61995.1 cardiolipin synthase [Kurthia sp. 11kri321]MEB6113662.1 cardiolipin synthase [Kurthia gibsonii]MEB7772822.1 cardiolipin synthase [Kurthia gibsonii]RXH52085.1 cardiolipin synthase [Kurthia gibsonii]